MLGVAFCALLFVFAGCQGGGSSVDPLADEDAAAGDGGGGGAPTWTPTYCGVSVVTFAGKAGEAGVVDGIGSNARLSVPRGMVYDGANTIYFADYGGHVVRSLDITTALVTTIAGEAGVYGSSDSPLLPTDPPARFCNPSFLALDGVTLYVTDTMNNTIRTVTLGLNTVATVAGDVNAGAHTFGDGVGTDAHFLRPTGLVIDGIYLYISDSANHQIRRMHLITLEVKAYAGGMRRAGWGDGVGALAVFYGPVGLVSDGTYIYVADERNCMVRRIELATAEVTSLAGYRQDRDQVDGPGDVARFNNPSDVALYGAGGLLIADHWNGAIREWDGSDITTLSGGFGELGHRDGPIEEALYFFPSGIVDTPLGIFVTDDANCVIRRIN